MNRVTSPTKWLVCYSLSGSGSPVLVEQDAPEGGIGHTSFISFPTKEQAGTWADNYNAQISKEEQE